MTPEALILLEKQLDNYPTILGFLNDRQISSASLMTPQGIATLTSQIHSDPAMINEAFSFLDCASVFHTVFGKGGLTFIDTIINQAARIRVLEDPELVIDPSKVQDHFTTSATDWWKLMQANPALRAVFVIAVLKNFFCRP